MNNIFDYATKELSQDAFLCWSINWLTQGADKPLYPYGKAMLDLFLADEKQERYYDVEVYNQYQKIDVLIKYKDSAGDLHALIIEDKTNTSEHDDQMQRYKKKILETTSKDADQETGNDLIIHLAYIKTGIMYDNDAHMSNIGAVVINLDDLLNVVSHFAKSNVSEILSDFNEHIQKIKNDRITIEKQIEDGRYETALKERYGQFYFLDKVFDARNKDTEIGRRYIEHKTNSSVYVDRIYAGTNNSGAPWTQYRFCGKQYPTNLFNANENEYHYLFWRIDCKSGQKPYIALRHYDSHAHTKNAKANERKKDVYRKLRSFADERYNNSGDPLFVKIGVRENYKESDLLFISVENLEQKHMTFSEVSHLLKDITASFKEIY